MDEKFKLNEVIKKFNIIPKKSLGQNFIFDFNLLNKIANYIKPIHNQNIIEIGPGPGGLTKSILEQRPKKLLVIEKDIIFKENLEFIFSHFPDTSCSIIINDFLDIDLNSLIKGKTKLLSNLPYNISSQILLRILPLNKHISEVLFTFQKELADRIISKPHTKDYSKISVITQSVCEISRKQNLPSTIFYPKPNVESSILKIIPKKNNRIKDFNILKKVTNIAFTQRRKKIINSLGKINNIQYYLDTLKIDKAMRAEDITVENYCNLANMIYEKTKK